jgi:methyl-accepting chemotaxis protein
VCSSDLDITVASDEQSEGVQQITRAVQQVGDAAQQTAAASEEMSAMAEELSGQASALRARLATFRFGSRSRPDDATTAPFREHVLENA